MFSTFESRNHSDDYIMNNDDDDYDYAEIPYEVKTCESGRNSFNKKIYFLRECPILHSITPINETSSVNRSFSIAFDFLEELNLDQLNSFTYLSKEVSLIVVDSCCVTTTHSFSSACQTKDTTISYCTLNPIFSTIVHSDFPKPPYPISHDKRCLETAKSEFLSSSQNTSENLNSSINTCTSSECLPSQNSYSEQSLLPKSFYLSDFENKYGLSSSILSNIPLDIKHWSPQTYNIYLNSSFVPQIPRFVTVSFRNNIGLIIERESIPYYKGCISPGVFAIYLDSYKEVHQFLFRITLNFLNCMPLNIIFPPFVLLDILRTVVIYFESDEFFE